MDPRTARLLNLAADPAANENEALSAIRMARKTLAPGTTFINLVGRTQPARSRVADLSKTISDQHREIDRLKAELTAAREKIERLTPRPIEDRVGEAVAESLTVVDVLRKLGWAMHSNSYKRLERVCRAHDISTEHFIGKGWRAGISTMRSFSEFVRPMVATNDLERELTALAEMRLRWKKSPDMLRMINSAMSLVTQLAHTHEEGPLNSLEAEALAWSGLMREVFAKMTGQEVH